MFLKNYAATFGSRQFHSSSRSLNSFDPYLVLGVNRGTETTDKQIKTKYYELAKKYHPDSNKSNEAKDKFLQIQKAYDILSNADKKQQYDQFGHSGDQPHPSSNNYNSNYSSAYNNGGGGGSPFEGFDIFDQLFKNQQQQQQQHGEDIQVQVQIPFMDAIKGIEKTINYVAIQSCTTCSGTGAKPGKSATTCAKCRGTGQTTFSIRGGFQMAAPCNACGGQGKTIAKANECSTCDGQGRVKARKSTTFTIPPGVDNGSKMRISRQGHAGPEKNSSAGDLYVIMKVQEHPIFQRSGADILSNVKIPLHVAILGGTVTIPTIDGDVELKVTPGVQPEEKRILRSRGVVILNKRGKGDHLVTFKILIPSGSALSEHEKNLITEALCPGNIKKESDVKESQTEGSEEPTKNTVDATNDQSPSFFQSVFKKVKENCK